MAGNKIKFDENEFRSMWLSDMPNTKIASIIGSSAAFVSHTARRLGLPKRLGKAHPKNTFKDTKEFRDAWEAGMSQVDIGKMLGCSHDYVGKLAKRFGYPKRPYWNAAQKADAEPKKQREGVVTQTVKQVTSGRDEAVKIVPVSMPAAPWNMEAEPVSEEALRAGCKADVLDLYSQGLSAFEISKSLLCAEIDVRHEIERLKAAGQVKSVGVLANA